MDEFTISEDIEVIDFGNIDLPPTLVDAPEIPTVEFTPVDISTVKPYEPVSTGTDGYVVDAWASGVTVHVWAGEYGLI